MLMPHEQDEAAEREQLRQRKAGLARALYDLAGISPRALNSYAKHHHGAGRGVDEMRLDALRAAVAEIEAWHGELQRARETERELRTAAITDALELHASPQSLVPLAS